MQKAWIRHALMVLLLGGLTWIFSAGRVQMHPVHRWNRAFADAAFMMLCLTLVGAAESLRQSIGAPLPPAEQQNLEKLLAPARQVLSTPAQAAALETGRGMTLERAVQFARSATARPT